MSPVPQKSDVIIEWEAILENLVSRKTILCLGAELFAFDGISLDDLLRRAVEGRAKAYEDGLFYFGGNDIIAYSKIKRVYQREFPGLEDILLKIADIPFHILISLTPDHQLEGAFDKRTFDYQHAVYVKRKAAPDVQSPSVELPLVYHMLGEIEQRESMVLTHDDLYDYFESIMEHRSMPQLLKDQINEAYSFIFLGLPFQKWYMQLLLRVLGQHTNRNALKYAASHALDKGMEAFCYDQFNILCVPDRIKAFVDELHRRCEEAGILRKGKSIITLKGSLISLIKEDKLQEVLDKLFNIVESRQPDKATELNLLINLSGRLSRLEQRQAGKSISHEHAEVEMGQIREGLINLTNDLSDE